MQSIILLIKYKHRDGETSVDLIPCSSCDEARQKIKELYDHSKLSSNKVVEAFAVNAVDVSNL